MSLMLQGLLLAFIHHKWIIHETFTNTLVWMLCRGREPPCLEISPSPTQVSTVLISSDSQLVDYNSSMSTSGIHTSTILNTYVPNRLLSFAFRAEWQKLQLQKDFSQRKQKSPLKDHMGNLNSSLHFEALPTRSPWLMSLSNLFSWIVRHSSRQFSNTSPGKPNLWQPLPPPSPQPLARVISALREECDRND